MAQQPQSVDLQKDDAVTFLAHGVVESLGEHDEVYITAFDRLFCRRADEVGKITRIDAQQQALHNFTPLLGARAKQSTPTTEMTSERVGTMLATIQLLGKHVTGFSNLVSVMQLAAKVHATASAEELAEELAKAILFSVSEIVVTALCVGSLAGLDQEAIVGVYQQVDRARDQMIDIFTAAVENDSQNSDASKEK